VFCAGVARAQEWRAAGDGGRAGLLVYRFPFQVSVAAALGAAQLFA
jgi:hypothetical protein